MKKENKINGMRPFLILWFSQSISTLGSSMTSFALILWVYGQDRTATSISMLSFFTYLPSVLFCFFAGALADRWDKKKIMLFSDAVAALGTIFILTMFVTGSLQIWHLYVVNFTISFMNAFQNPASYVAVSLLAPKDQYTRVGGMQAFSRSLVTVVTPAFANALLAFGGLHVVLIADLATFCIAFSLLLFFIKIPKISDGLETVKEGFWKSCRIGLQFLNKHRPVLYLIVFFAFINLLAYLTGYGIMPALFLSRPEGNETITGLVSSAVGLGTMVGGIVVTLLKPPKSRTRVMFLTCGLSFLLANIPWAVSLSPVVWIIVGFVGNFPLAFLNANIGVTMRAQIPLEMQGRVFAARDTLQFFTVPLGLALSGVIADCVFEPMMAGSSWIQSFFSFFVGAGTGSGIAAMFLLTGVIGAVSSFLALRSKTLRQLDNDFMDEKSEG